MQTKFDFSNVIGMSQIVDKNLVYHEFAKLKSIIESSRRKNLEIEALTIELKRYHTLLEKATDIEYVMILDKKIKDTYKSINETKKNMELLSNLEKKEYYRPQQYNINKDAESTIAVNLFEKECQLKLCNKKVADLQEKISQTTNFFDEQKEHLKKLRERHENLLTIAGDNSILLKEDDIQNNKGKLEKYVILRKNVVILEKYIIQAKRYNNDQLDKQKKDIKQDIIINKALNYESNQIDQVIIHKIREIQNLTDNSQLISKNDIYNTNVTEAMINIINGLQEKIPSNSLRLQMTPELKNNLSDSEKKYKSQSPNQNKSTLVNQEYGDHVDHIKEHVRKADKTKEKNKKEISIRSDYQTIGSPQKINNITLKHEISQVYKLPKNAKSPSLLQKNSKKIDIINNLDIAECYDNLVDSTLGYKISIVKSNSNAIKPKIKAGLYKEEDSRLKDDIKSSYTSVKLKNNDGMQECNNIGDSPVSINNDIQTNNQHEKLTSRNIDMLILDKVIPNNNIIPSLKVDEKPNSSIDILQSTKNNERSIPKLNIIQSLKTNRRDIQKLNILHPHNQSEKSKINANVTITDNEIENVESKKLLQDDHISDIKSKNLDDKKEFNTKVYKPLESTNDQQEIKILHNNSNSVLNDNFHDKQANLTPKNGSQSNLDTSLAKISKIDKTHEDVIDPNHNNKLAALTLLKPNFSKIRHEKKAENHDNKSNISTEQSTKPSLSNISISTHSKKVNISDKLSLLEKSDNREKYEQENNQDGSANLSIIKDIYEKDLIHNNVNFKLTLHFPEPNFRENRRFNEKSLLKEDKHDTFVDKKQNNTINIVDTQDNSKIEGSIINFKMENDSNNRIIRPKFIVERLRPDASPLQQEKSTQLDISEAKPIPLTSTIKADTLIPQLNIIVKKPEKAGFWSKKDDDSKPIPLLKETVPITTKLNLIKNLENQNDQKYLFDDDDNSKVVVLKSEIQEKKHLSLIVDKKQKEKNNKVKV